MMEQESEAMYGVRPPMNLVFTLRAIPTSLLIGASATTTNAKLEVRGGVSAEYYSATSTTATSSLLHTSLTALLLNGDYITDLTGSGLMVTSGTLALDTSGDWTGTLMATGK